MVDTKINKLYIRSVYIINYDRHVLGLGGTFLYHLWQSGVAFWLTELIVATWTCR